MLRIDRVELRDFGPYRGEQCVEFAGQDGVIIVSGENMRGKTTLLNAIRFALFGRVIGRAEKEQDLPKLLNILAKRDGQRAFSVTLSVRHDAVSLELIRRCVIEGEPGHETAETVTTVVRDGVPLSNTEGHALLKSLMPEGIARFFLFDGELLQQYELLLDDDSALGHRITEAVEQILGVPVLLQLRSDLDLLRQQASDTEARALQRDKRTERLGQQLENSRRLSDECGTEVERHHAEVQRLQTESEALEEMLNRSTKLLNLIGEKRELERQIEQREVDQRDAQKRLTALLERAWHWPLVGRLEQHREELTRQVATLDQERQTWERTKLLDHLREECSTGTCPVCTQRVNTKVPSAATSALPAPDMAQSQRALQALGRLSSIQLSREGGTAIEMFRQVSGIQAEIAQLRSRRDDLEEQIGDRDESGLIESQRRWRLVQDGLAHARIALSNARQKLSEQEASIKRLQEQIRTTVGPSAGAETKRREYMEALRDVVERSVSCYREALRTQVEKDASELFKQMTTEPEYERLAITPSYGLRIIHRDGTEVPLRSSGAEHIVALSLVGALQKNSPVRGPLFIDSPFGRLDSRHKEQVIASLPTMADQVVLLVYSKEVDENVARRVLAGRLLCEYELVRISARETQIEKRRL